MSMDKVAVILINYRGYQDTSECVESLLNQTYRNFRVYIIDNCSGDGSAEKLQTDYADRCTVYRSEVNGGFSFGNNVGIRLARQDGCNKFLFLNNDTIADENLIAEMRILCNKNTAVTAKTYYYSNPDILWDTGAAITATGRWINRGIDEKDVGQYDAAEEVDSFTGHCVMVDGETIDMVGMWDESFFMYTEDTEYALRMKEHGIAIRYAPRAKLWHKVSRSSGGNSNPRVIYYTVRNRSYVLNMRQSRPMWRIRNTVWVAWLLFKQKVLRDESCKYVDRAISDYLHNVRGKVEF